LIQANEREQISRDEISRLEQENLGFHSKIADLHI
jgi:hypothetical protein